MQTYVKGNAKNPESPTSHFRGWLAGDFDQWTNGDAEKERIASNNRLLATPRVGVKFQTEPKGRTGPAYKDDGDGKVTLALLISGELRINLVNREHESEYIETLRKLGDYLAWPSSTYSHSWEALEDSTVVTVRWAEVG